MDEENIETNESFVDMQNIAAFSSSGAPNQIQFGAQDYTYSASSQLNHSLHFGASHFSRPTSSGLGSYSAAIANRATINHSQMVQGSQQMFPHNQYINGQRVPTLADEPRRIHKQPSSQNEIGRGKSAHGGRHQNVIDIQSVNARTVINSPKGFGSQSRLLTNLSDSQKLKVNNPFRKDQKDRSIISSQIGVREETQENERLRTTLANTQQQTTNAGGFDFTKSALGLTQRLIQAFTSPSPSAGNHSTIQNSPNNFKFNPSTYRNNLGATTPIQFPSAFPQGYTQETQQSRVSLARPPIKRYGSPQLTDYNRLQTQQTRTHAQQPTSRGLNLQKNITRIIQNNIIESDIERQNKLVKKNNIDLEQNPILEEVSMIQPYEELDTKRVIQLQQQTTERQMFDSRPTQMHVNRIESEESPCLKIARVESDTRSSMAIENMGNQIKFNLKLLQSQSPFKDLADQNSGMVPHRQAKPQSISVYMHTISSTDDQDQSFMKNKNRISNITSIKEIELENDDININLNQQHSQRNNLETELRSKQNRSSIPPSGKTTERQTMGIKDSKSIDSPSLNTNNDKDLRDSNINEQQKFFNLIQNQHQTLGQQITKGIKKSSKRQNFKDQSSFIESSQPSSSFDSINPNDLILQTQTANSNYYSMNSNGTPATNSKFSKLQPVINNGLYLQTRSSGYSSIYQLTKGDEEGNETDRQGIQITGNQETKETGIDRCLIKIDQNINSFTTQEFEELRDKVKSMGYYKAQIVAQQQFGLKQPKSKVKGLSLSFITEDKREESIIIDQNSLQLEANEEDYRLNRRLVLTSESGDYSILCSGFLSSPGILFDPYSSTPKHLATILDHRTDPPSLGQFLPLKLMSIQSLVQLKKKCTILSCGFEHCLALIDQVVWSWGCGGSGCLGHGDYKTVSEPTKVEGIREKISYIEAGGYHNGVIAQSSKGSHVYVWGRGDVGQLGLAPDQITKDQKGHVLLEPAQLQFKKQIVQLALGDAHTLFLTQQGRILSCGWHELGQLGISHEKRVANQNAGILIHKVDIKDEKTGKQIKIKQVSCGAVFSVALSENGDVYTWGSNNNGQMGMSGESESECSDLGNQLITQVDLPTKVEIQRDDQSPLTQVIAGDCHVLAADENNVYAWGQGQILEDGQNNKKIFLDVICGQPVQIQNDLENKMNYQVNQYDEELFNDDIKGKITLQTAQKHPSTDQKDSQYSQSQLKKKPFNIPPLALSEINKNQEQPQHLQSSNKFGKSSSQILFAVGGPNGINTAQGSNNGQQAHLSIGSGLIQNPQKEFSQKTMKSRWPSLSNDYDLVTIKNTEDYNNFIKNASDIKKMDGESLKKFEQKLQSYLLRESSGDEMAGTFIENKLSAEGYSDLIPIIEEDGRLSNTQKQINDKIKNFKNETALYSSQQNPYQFNNMGTSAPARKTALSGQLVDFSAENYYQNGRESLGNSEKRSQLNTRDSQKIKTINYNSFQMQENGKLNKITLRVPVKNQTPDNQTRNRSKKKNQIGEPDDEMIKALENSEKQYQPVTATKVHKTLTTSEDQVTQSNGKFSIITPQSDQNKQSTVIQDMKKVVYEIQSGRNLQSDENIEQNQDVQADKFATQENRYITQKQKLMNDSGKKSNSSRILTRTQNQSNSAQKVQMKESDKNRAPKLVAVPGSKPREEDNFKFNTQDNRMKVLDDKINLDDQNDNYNQQIQDTAHQKSNMSKNKKIKLQNDNNFSPQSQNHKYKFQPNAFGGGTGETGRDHLQVDQQVSKTNSDVHVNNLSLKNKVEKISRQHSPEPSIVTDRGNNPVLISSRPGSSGRSRSPCSSRSPKAFMRKNSKNEPPKIISSKGFNQDRLNQTQKTNCAKDSLLKNKNQILVDQRHQVQSQLQIPSNEVIHSNQIDATYLTQEDSVYSHLQIGNIKDHSLISKSSLDRIN